MVRSRQIILFLLLCSASDLTHADQLLLVNGDRLSGTEINRDQNNLQWASDNFGQLTISLAQVASITPTEIPTEHQDNGSQQQREQTAPQPHNYHGELSLTAAYSSGNRDREDWDLESTVQWYSGEADKGDMRHRTHINYETHSLDNTDAKESYEINHDMHWFISDSWYWANGASWGGDQNRSVDRRYSVGSSLGHQLWEDKNHALSLETGIYWVSEDFQNQPPSEKATWRWAVNYRKVLFNDLQLDHSHEVLTSLKDGNDLEARAAFSLKAPLIASVYTEIKLELIYDHQPAQDAKRLDNQLTLGVNYNW